MKPRSAPVSRSLTAIEGRTILAGIAIPAGCPVVQGTPERYGGASPLKTAEEIPVCPPQVDV